MSKFNVCKICFIKTASYHLFANTQTKVQGGAEVQFYFLAKELAKDKNFQVSFATGDFGQKDVEEFDGVRLYKTVTPQKKDSIFKKILQTIKYWQIFKKINADVYFTSAFNNVIILTSWFCKIHGKKHLHRTAHEQEVNNFYKKSLSGKLFLRAIKKTNGLITQNQEHQELIKKNLKRDSIIIKNSFDFSEIEKIKVENKKHILWVARFLDWKNPDLFLKLARNFPKEKFIMICNFEKQFEAKWKKMEKEVKKIGNIKLIEKVLFSKVQTYFDQAKIFISTSDCEGFPNTFIQAAIGQTPILSYKVNPDDFLNEYKCGYCTNGNFDKMTKYLDKLLTDQKNWQEKSENIFKYAKENHDIKENIKKLKRLLLELK